MSTNEIAELKSQVADVPKPQGTYMLALAAYQTARDARKRAIDAITVPQPSAEEIRALVDANDADAIERYPYYAAITAIDDQFNLSTFGSLLREAENVMIEWAADHARTHFTPAQFRQIAPVFAQAPGLHGKLRQDLVDLCFRLKAE